MYIEDNTIQQYEEKLNKITFNMMDLKTIFYTGGEYSLWS